MPEREGDSRELKEEKGVVVAFAAAPHPLIADAFVSFLVVRISDKWVLCKVEGKGPFDWAEAMRGLRMPVEGKYFYQYAMKGFGLQLPFWRLKKYIESEIIVPEIKWEWINDGEEPWVGVIKEREQKLEGGTDAKPQ